MNYELAKQLKDAGFPQQREGLFMLVYCTSEDCCNNQLHLIHDDNDEGNETGNDYGHRTKDWNEYIKCPTLPELIDSFQGRYKYIDGLINDAQISLMKTIGVDGHYYIACLDGDWESHEHEMKYLFTDKDADVVLANLYLALHKK